MVQIKEKYGNSLDIITVWADTEEEIWLDLFSEYKQQIDWSIYGIKITL